MTLTVCNQQGCPELTPSTRCPAHTEPPRQRKAQHYANRGGSTWQWRKTRARIIERDGGRCQSCGSTTNLHVHHRDGDAMNDQHTNLRALCQDCHHKCHAGVGHNPLAPPADSAPSTSPIIRIAGPRDSGGR